jgi:hypothetical protein
MGYSKDFIQINDGYVIKNYSVALICVFYILMTLGLLLLPIPIFQIIDFIKNKGNRGLIESILFFIILCIVIIAVVIYNKKIIIYNTKKIMIFKYGLFPFVKIKKLDMDNIKEISINHVQNAVLGSDQFKGSIIGYFEGIISGIISGPNHHLEEIYKEKMDKSYKKKIYIVDLIDKNQYSYTIFVSEIYNEDLIKFANKIGEIINKEVDDKNTIEGYKNIYKKNII